jgi:hypothetical protein
MENHLKKKKNERGYQAALRATDGPESGSTYDSRGWNVLWWSMRDHMQWQRPNRGREGCESDMPQEWGLIDNL